MLYIVTFSILYFSYDVVFTAGADVILSKFLDFDSRVVFSAEGFCWPDQGLAVSLYTECIINCCVMKGMHNSTFSCWHRTITKHQVLQ